jgi:hypothetical protein
MSADDAPLDRSRDNRSASRPMLGRGPRRWPVRRSDLELFLSADAREHRQGEGVDQALETEQDNKPQGDAR